LSGEDRLTQPPQNPALPSSVPDAEESAQVPAVEIFVPPEPGPPPRAKTPAAVRRSWMEPMVRFWVLSTLLLVVILGWFVAEQGRDFFIEKRLIAQGTAVVATVADVNGDSRVGAKFPPGTPATLTFKFNGQDEVVSGPLKYETDHDFVVIGQTVPLHVDPGDPSQWTDRTEAEPIARRLIAGAVVIPAMLATGFAALLGQRRRMKIWRDGIASAYSVYETRTSALAPLSHAVRCVSAQGGGDDLVTVYLPGKVQRPQTGEVLWLIQLAGKPNAAIAARAFE
jgi:hypothetical protein